MDKNVFKDVNYGMYIVGAKNKKNVGCVINTLTQLTSVNPIISICVNKDNCTNSVIKEAKKFSVSILDEQINPNVIATFGFKSSNDTDKFADVEYEMVENIPVLLTGVCSYLICEVIEYIDVETHDLFIAKVIDTKKINNNVPMTYKYYQETMKGKAPKKAPTYVDDNVSKDNFVCDICGYVHEGPIPDDFVCPICGANASHFKKKEA